MKSILNKEIDQLLLTVDFVERKFQKNYYILNNLEFDKKNMIFYRNLYYLDLIIEKIKENFEEINIIRKIIKSKKLRKDVKKVLKFNAKVKAMASIILLKELTKMMNKYEFGNFDFEVQTIVSQERDVLMGNVPEKYKEKILEDFEDIDFDYNYFISNEHLLEEFGWAKKAWRSTTRAVRRAGRAVARGARRVGRAVAKGASAAWNAAKKFAKKILDKAKAAYNKIKNFATKALRNIGKFFKKIFNSIRKILGFFKKIATFLFKTLLSFIKLMWKLMMGLINFATKWIPRFIKKTFTFFKYLKIKAKKTGAVTVGLFFLLNMVIAKYWEMLIGTIKVGEEELSPMIPSQLIEFPALFFTAHIFWTQTESLAKIQNDISNFFVSRIKVLKFFFTTILGLPNSTVFTARMPFRRRMMLLGIYIKRHFLKVALRLLIFVFVSKLFAKFAFKEIIEEGIPDARDFILFPIVIARFIIKTTFSIF